MSLVNTETGEILEPLDSAAAERRAERISLRLDAIADNYAAVMPMIREAIEKRDDLALGYRSPGEYVADRFGGALQRLGVDVRRAVVGELTAAGLSTRAIAPVVGVHHDTVARDVRAGVVGTTPAVEVTPVDETADWSEDDLPTATEPVACDLPAPTPVVGIDGKTYQRPTPSKPKRRPLTDTARDAGWDLRKSAERLQRIADDDRFNVNKDEVAAHLRGHLTHAIEVLQDVLDRINN